jgi:hypothetical protein
MLMQSPARRLLFATACLFGLMLWASVAPVGMRARNGHDWTAVFLLCLLPGVAAVYLFVSGWRLGRRGPERFVVGLLFLLAAAWLIGAVRQDEAAHAARVQSLRNVKNIALAFQMYVADNDDIFPPAGDWCDRIEEYVKNRDVFRSPIVRGLDCAFAYNAALDGASLAQLDHPADTVVIFESDQGWNAVGGRGLLPDEPRHLGGDNYGFADGSARWLNRKKLPDGTWAKEPEVEVRWEVGVKEAAGPRAEG